MTLDHPTPTAPDEPRAPICRRHFTCHGGCGAETRSPLADNWVIDGPLSWCPSCERRAQQ